MPPKHRPSLQQGLDKDVFQIVRKFQDDQPEGANLPTTNAVYRYLQASNSTLKRKPKQLLQNSIERVLAVLEESEDSDDFGPIDIDFEDPKIPDRSANFMNKSIVTAWAGSSGTATPVANGDGVKKRDAGRQANGEPVKKKRKAVEQVDRSPPTSIRLEDIGGVDDVMELLGRHLIMPLRAPEEYDRLKISIPRGILLHGPPGCGKTVISRAFAAELKVPFIEIQGPSIVSGMSGESEQKVREHFEEARRLAPCLVFIDEIDVIAPKRETSQSQMEKRIVAQLLLSMDGLAMEQNDGKPVIVLAATNRPDSLDPALRRGGRFDTEINMGVPNEAMREQIIRAQTRETPLADDIDFQELAKRTAGFVGADLRDLVGKAGEWTMEQYREALVRQAAEIESEMDLDIGLSKTLLQIRRLNKRLDDKEMERPSGFEHQTIKMEAFLRVLPYIQPSSKREGFATIPDTTWDDIGALADVRKQLEKSVVQRIQYPARYKKVGITTPSGVLLWGPPGCGKTLLAKAVARESKANFISVKGPELLNKYVGESERAVRQVFTRARSSIPCVLFFDELDALVPRRDDSLSEASSRVVNTLLTELDGIGDTREGIYIIAATNRPEIIDPAMLRPGRLETFCYVGLPGSKERVEILRASMRKIENIDLGLAEFASVDSCDGFTGADLTSLRIQAGQAALDRGDEVITLKDFETAVNEVRKSVSSADAKRYEKMKELYQTKF